jgi:hypothetical protein
MIVRIALLAGLMALAVVYYYFLGYGPTASEIYDEKEWWQPRGWIHQMAAFSALSDMARDRESMRRFLPVLLFSIPAVAGIWAGFRLFKGALGRSVTVSLGALLIAMAYYGCVRDGVWRFFEWRFIMVVASFLGVLVSFWFAPSLLRALNRAPKVVMAVVLAAIALGAFVLSTEITGTNTDMRLNISPWPVVTVFGMLLLGMMVAALHIGAGAGVWVRSRMPEGAAGLAAAGGAALIAGCLAAFVPFSEPGVDRILTMGVLSLIYAAFVLLLTKPDALAASGLSRVAAGVLIALIVGFSNNFAAGYQTHVRDDVAQQVLVALEEYKKEHGTYPDRLRHLKPDYLEEVPRPHIGLLEDEDEYFNYSKYSQEDFSLEFASVQWVQCAYSPPYEFAAYDPSEDEEEEVEDEEEDDWEEWDTRPDVAAKPTEDQLEMQAKLKEAGLAGAWSCATEPPKLW